MAINNNIHKIEFRRKLHIIYLDEFTADNDVITVDSELFTADKTHDLIKL